jgi:type VI secretion system protein ImpA
VWVVAVQEGDFLIVLEKLLQPVSAYSPCGPNLEYDPEFLELDQAAQAKPEQVFGSTLIPAEEPDWAEVGRRAEALLARTKDLRVAVLLTRGLSHTDHLGGLGEGLGLVLGLLERYWQGLYPLLDNDDGDDPTMRLNALAPLSSADALLKDVKTAWLVAPGPNGRLAVRDLLLASRKLQPLDGDVILTQAQVEGIIGAASGANPEVAESPRRALERVEALQKLLNERVEAQRAPDLRPLYDVLRLVVQTCAAATRAGNSDDAENDGAAATGDAGARAGSGGQIRSREEAIRVLDRVCGFLERTEPANPAPLLIRRAQRLMTKNFVQIIEDLAPDSLSLIHNIAGIREQEPTRE